LLRVISSKRNSQFVFSDTHSPSSAVCRLLRKKGNCYKIESKKNTSNVELNEELYIQDNLTLLSKIFTIFSDTVLRKLLLTLSKKNIIKSNTLWLGLQCT